MFICTKINRIFILLLSIFSLVGCSANSEKIENPNYGAGAGESTGITVQVMFQKNEETTPGMLEKFGTEQSDVETVTMSASWADGSRGPVTCTKTTPDPYYKCNMNDISTTLPIDLTLSAMDATLVEIYTGSTTVTLIQGAVLSVSINMIPVEADPTDLHMPLVLGTVFAEPFGITGVPENLDLTIADIDGDFVTVTYSSSTGGIFSPASEVITTPTFGSITLSTTYTAAVQATEYWDDMTVTLDDGTGFMATFTFYRNIKISSEITATINLSPDVTGININKTGLSTIFTANVVDEEVATLTYIWDIGGTIYTTNPVTAAPTIPIGTVISVTVTDIGGLSRTYSMEWSFSGYSIEAIATNSASSPIINNAGQVAWMGDGGTDGGTDSEIFLYDINTGITTQITTNSGFDYGTQLNDNGQVVWYGQGGTDGGTDFEIFLYDITTGITTQITTNSDHEERAMLNNAGQVVWMGDGGTDGGTDSEIFLYDINTGITTQITTGNGEEFVKDINVGHIVWIDIVPSGSYNDEYFLYDINTGITTQLTSTSNLAESDLQMNDAGQVVWKSGNADTQNIMLYDTTTDVTTQIFTISGLGMYARAPQINDAGQVAWFVKEGVFSTTSSLNLYDIATGITTTVITENKSLNDNLLMNNTGQMMWVAEGGVDSGYDTEIYFYNGISVTQMMSNEVSDSLERHQINNAGQMVWEDTGNIILATP